MNLPNILKTYGLNEKQAKIYLACLELGSAPVQKISEITALPRSTCYEVLDSLKPLGIISSFQKKKIKHFSAEDPRALARSAEEKAKLLSEALPEFLAVYGKSSLRPSVRFYQGKTAMKGILKEILEEGKELLAFSSSDDLTEALGEDFENYIKERAKRKIPSRVIMRDTPMAHLRRQTARQELRQVKIAPAGFEHHSLVFVWGRKVAMFSLKHDLTVLVIESEEMNRFYRAIFEYVWNSLPA